MKTSLLVVLLQLCFHIFVFPLHMLWYLGLWGPFCKKAYPYFMTQASVLYNWKVGDKKRELFSNLMDFADSNGVLKLLEIGTGSGPNFQFYPRGCRITCTEPNPNFHKFIIKNLSKNRHLQLDRCLVTVAEDLHQILDASVDVVVSTTVLCSVRDPEAVIREILRVLRQGGAFFFLEHVAGPPSSLMHSWQHIWKPTWNILFDGCLTNRETWKVLEKANFSKLNLRHIRPLYNIIPIHPHIIGYGIK